MNPAPTPQTAFVEARHRAGGRAVSAVAGRPRTSVIPTGAVRMLAAYRAGEDLHALTARALLGNSPRQSTSAGWTARGAGPGGVRGVGVRRAADRGRQAPGDVCAYPGLRLAPPGEGRNRRDLPTAAPGQK